MLRGHQQHDLHASCTTYMYRRNATCRVRIKVDARAKFQVQASVVWVFGLPDFNVRRVQFGTPSVVALRAPRCLVLCHLLSAFGVCVSMTRSPSTLTRRDVQAQIPKP